jgi:FO synthase
MVFGQRGAMSRRGRKSERAQDLLEEFEELGPSLLAKARDLRDAGHGRIVTFSPKVFLPVTRLCRDVCTYCSFAKTPRQVPAPYMSLEEVLGIVREGRKLGCTEALFTLGDKPELRYADARVALDALGFTSTADYVAALCEAVLAEGLLPHVNAGVLDRAALLKLRAVSVSQGIMVEQTTPRLFARGGAHFGSPDKDPAVRLAMIEEAGRLAIPFTTGILIGIGETRLERIESLLAIRDIHACHGHIQEIIVQNFRAKADTRMAGARDPDLAELMWSVAAARLIFGAEMNVQAPPNLSYADFPRLLDAGINDWGGVSPLTPDHVNPEAPWPSLETLRRATEGAGKVLVERLPIYPAWCHDLRWTDAEVRPALLRAMDAEGYARADRWSPGLSAAPRPRRVVSGTPSPDIAALIDRSRDGRALPVEGIATLFRARGADETAIFAAADAIRKERVGDTVGYVVNRNINYTNVCSHACGFCAFSKGKRSEALAGRPYDLDLEEVGRRAREAWDRGATEVCMQGGIHPDYSGRTYLSLLSAVKAAVSDMHVHAFSPLEVTHGAATLGVSIATFLRMLKEAGLGSLPGTAAEILVDEVRAVICPGKLTTAEWLGVVEEAHAAGLRTTATIMFGHFDRVDHWAAHLAAIRALQERTGGFTEFVPLPFVHMEAPLYHRGGTRKGPTWRETLLVIAVSRLALAGAVDNIQLSWVKMGEAGAAAALGSGANDFGGTLMNESISRAAGTQHGQEMPPEKMDSAIRAVGRTPWQRTTLYGDVPAERRVAGRAAAPLADIRLPAAGKRARVGSRAKAAAMAG